MRIAEPAPFAISLIVSGSERIGLMSRCFIRQGNRLIADAEFQAALFSPSHII
jgi:hypothetical protein